ncbi:MAG: YdcF family protein [Bacteroidia bacterium]
MTVKTKPIILKPPKIALGLLHHLDLGLNDLTLYWHGSHDERVAEHAAQLFLDGYADIGSIRDLARSKGLWKDSGGQKFAEIAERMGVNRSQIFIEDQATNSGENITKSKDLLAANDMMVKTGVLVTKPYMRRRAFATASKQWPEISWLVSAPDLSFYDYAQSETQQDQMIQLMVGDLQRIKICMEKVSNCSKFRIRFGRVMRF